ncbi:MAG: hypothetical protein QNJ00_17685 [Woeseiaceae bacterium]|nr:hypothetical protein [Woeseiaceae bacterium]
MIGICAATALLLASAAVADEDRTNNESEIKLKVELEQSYADNACKAQLELEYYQAGSRVHVESELFNDVCGPSLGSYIIQVRLRDDDGEITTRDFGETWARDDAEPIKAERDYEIGDNVDVIRVRSTKLRCECAEPAAE